jgi:hypothetical protein
MGGTCGTCVTKLNTYRAVVANLKETEYLEILEVGGKIILKWILKEWAWRTWTGIIWLLGYE